MLFEPQFRWGTTFFLLFLNIDIFFLQILKEISTRAIIIFHGPVGNIGKSFSSSVVETRECENDGKNRVQINTLKPICKAKEKSIIWIDMNEIDSSHHIFNAWSGSLFPILCMRMRLKMWNHIVDALSYTLFLCMNKNNNNRAHEHTSIDGMIAKFHSTSSTAFSFSLNESSERRRHTRTHTNM